MKKINYLAYITRKTKFDNKISKINLMILIHKVINTGNSDCISLSTIKETNITLSLVNINPILTDIFAYL